MVVASGTNPFAKEMAIRKRIATINFDFVALSRGLLCGFPILLRSVNLVEGIDVPIIEAYIAQYQKENAEQIMNAQARKAEEYAAAVAASKGQPANDTSSQEGFGTGTQGYYAPSIPGVAIAQPKPTGTAPQPFPSGSDPYMQLYGVDDEEMMKLKAERGGRAGGWSIELSKKRALEEAFSGIWI
ncbi:hypothetical protein C3L33_03795, partial [Rhododendron williamsianum]